MTETGEAADCASEGIAIRGLSKYFGSREQGVCALDDIGFTIADGEFVAVVGPSGCGKSTLMRLVARLIPPTDGTISVFGDRSDLPPPDLAIVFQSPVLLAWRDVLRNVLFPASITGRKSPALEAEARRLIDAVGLSEFVTRYPHELSGGMKQRASIARALLLHPRLLLMDEPFGALDALTREQMRIDLEALWLSSRMTVLFITHSIDEAVLLADRVIVMTPRPGRIDRIFDVDIPRPRGLEARRHLSFVELNEAITEIFLSRGVLRRQAHSLGAPRE